ncbi:MAG: hypothetical protein ACE5GT_10000 [Rhodospirillales bacterium]
MRTHATLVAFCVMVVGFAFAGSANAALIGFEGIAAANTQTTETNSTNTFNGFDVFVPHGHYQGLGFLQPDPSPSSGSDWLLHDHATGFAPNEPVEITVSGGGIFAVTSIDASEWDIAFGGGHTLTLTGHLSGGGTTMANFTTDDAFGFETFVVAGLAGFDNLVQLDIIGNSSNLGPCVDLAVCGSLGYDNIVASVVPLPPALLLFGTGLSALGFMMWRRRKAS